MYCVFIVNPKAGEKDKKKLIKKMESAFRMSDNFFIKEQTYKKGDAEVIAKKYAEKYGEQCLIISCGGDGTVHEIANGMCGTKAALIVLPMGTGNDFCKKVYGTKKLDLHKIMKHFELFSGKPKYDIKPIDLIDVNGVKCINVFSFGFDTKVETMGRKIAEKAPQLSSHAYDIAAGAALFTNMKYKINMKLDTVDMYGNVGKFDKTIDYTLLALCNGSYYGGGFCPALESKLDDGVLEVCYIDAINALQAAPIIPSFSNGSAHEKFSNKVHMIKMTKGVVSSVDGKEMLGEYDGENFFASEVNFEIVPKSLNLCVLKDE